MCVLPLAYRKTSINSNYDVDLNILDLGAPCLTSTQKMSPNRPKKSFSGDLPLELSSSPAIHAANGCCHATIHQVNVLGRMFCWANLGHCGPYHPMAPSVGCPNVSQTLALQVTWNPVLCVSTQSKSHYNQCELILRSAWISLQLWRGELPRYL